MRNIIEHIFTLALVISFFWWIFAYPLFPIFEDEPTHMVEWALSLCAGITTYILFQIHENSSKISRIGPDLGYIMIVIVVIASIFVTGHAMRIQVYRDLPCTKTEVGVCNVCTQTDYNQGGSETCLSWEQEECERCLEKTYYVR